ncbi:MAG: hypothetical protein IJR39_04815 [Treponema sp.]|nr:hypothetical protein [Treponema sp.]
MFVRFKTAASDIEKVSEKFDAEKITEIVEAASTPKEAMEAIHAFYPELEVEKMQEQMDFVQSQFEAAAKGEKSSETVELTEKELDMVSGGGLGDWFKKNWKTVAVVAAITVGAALTCGVMGAALGSMVGTMAAIKIGAGIGAAVGGATTGTLLGIGLTIDTAK